MRTLPSSTALAGCLAAGLLVPPAGAAQPEPISLATIGSFHVGGRMIDVTGQPVREVLFTPGGVPAKVDPNGRYLVEGMYVQYFIPAKPRGAVPLLLWHGGGLTGVTYETTPDGREGWLNYFLRRGWAVYNSDAVERGRSGFNQFAPSMQGAPLFLTVENPFERFRIGAGPGSWNEDPAKRRQLPGNQFPADSYLNFVAQGVPRWTTTDQATIDAYVAEVDKVCPCVLVVHSQAGQFGHKVAQARPDKIKALVLVEPAGIGDGAQVARQKDMPILAIFGDHIEQDSRWPAIRAGHIKYLEAIRAAGGAPEVVDLPARGLAGNSHMMMMDKSSDQVAELIQKWLEQKGLWK